MMIVPIISRISCIVIRISNLLCLVDGRCDVSISLAPPAILGKTKGLGDDDSLPRTTIDASDPMYASGIGVQVPLASLSMIPLGLSASIPASQQCPSLRTLRMPENILILADWRLAAIVDDTMPPRDPDDDDDEKDEEDEERDDQPPVVREPEDRKST